MVYQVKFVVVYTPLYKTQAKDSNKPNAENSFTLLFSNEKYLVRQFGKYTRDNLFNTINVADILITVFTNRFLQALTPYKNELAEVVGETSTALNRETSMETPR